MAEITISLQDLGILLIFAGIIALLIYLIVLVKNLIPSAKSMAKIMADAEVISGVARDSAEEAEKVIGDVSASVSTIADIIRGNQSVVSAMTNIINALGSLNNLLDRKSRDASK